MKELPLLDAVGRVCTLPAGGRSLGIRRFRSLLSRATSRGATDRGVRLELPRTIANRFVVHAFVRVERRCCARFQYRVVDVARAPLVLEVTADARDLDDLRILYLGIDHD